MSERPTKKGFGLAEIDGSFLSSIAEDAQKMHDELGGPNTLPDRMAEFYFGKRREPEEE